MFVDRSETFEVACRAFLSLLQIWSSFFQSVLDFVPSLVHYTWKWVRSWETEIYLLLIAYKHCRNLSFILKCLSKSWKNKSVDLSKHTNLHGNLSLMGKGSNIFIHVSVKENFRSRLANLEMTRTSVTERSEREISPSFFRLCFLRI